MTGRDFIKWILDNREEDTIFAVQYRDSGGDYPGADEILYLCEETVKDENGWQYKRILL